MALQSFSNAHSLHSPLKLGPFAGKSRSFSVHRIPAQHLQFPCTKNASRSELKNVGNEQQRECRFSACAYSKCLKRPIWDTVVLRLKSASNQDLAGELAQNRALSPGRKVGQNAPGWPSGQGAGLQRSGAERRKCRMSGSEAV